MSRPQDGACNRCDGVTGAADIRCKQDRGLTSRAARELEDLVRVCAVYGGRDGDCGGSGGRERQRSAVS